MEEKLLPAKRKQKIIDYLKNNGEAKILALSEAIGVSEATVRRDLDELDAKGKLKRTFGGAVLLENQSVYEPVHRDKLSFRIEEKKRIAGEAAKYVHDGDSVLLDAGTTTYYIAQELTRFKNLTIFTYDLFIAMNVRFDPSCLFILIGGSVRQEFNVVVGGQVEDTIRELRVDVAFLGADKIDDIDFNIYNANLLEARIKRDILKFPDRYLIRRLLQKHITHPVYN